MVARLSPRRLLLGSGVPERYAESAILASSQLEVQRGGREPFSSVGEKDLLVTCDLDEVKTLHMLGQGVVLLLYPHSSRERSRAFVTWAECERREGLVLDFYDGAIIAHLPRVKYLYRSSL